MVTVPSKFSCIRLLEVSNEMGYTAVLYQNVAMPTAWRMGPVSLAYSAIFRS